MQALLQCNCLKRAMPTRARACNADVPMLRKWPLRPKSGTPSSRSSPCLKAGGPISTAAKLDTHGLPAFHRRVYEVTRTIPPGVTLSYGEVAKRLGSPGAARAVGQALGQNPFALLVPCHRVLSANGEMRGFSAHGGTATKRRLLAIERDGTPRSSSTP